MTTKISRRVPLTSTLFALAALACSSSSSPPGAGAGAANVGGSSSGGTNTNTGGSYTSTGGTSTNTGGTSTNTGGTGTGGASSGGGTSTGGENTGGTSTGGTGTGGTSTGGTSTGGKGTGGTSTGGKGTGGTSTGGTNTGGTNTGGTSTGGKGTGGTSTGGTNTGGSSTGGTSSSCTNPRYTLPLNPTNPQDGVTLSGFYVDTDTWNAANYQVSQTMYICDYNNWYVIANMNNNTHDGAVKTYPNVHKDFSASPKISSFNTISSSFAHVAPHVGIYEFAYDMWLNGIASSGSTEVMIWTDNYFQVPSGSSLETVTFDGQSYKVYKAGSYIAFVDDTNVTSGTVNLLSFFNHIIAKGWIPATSTVGAIDYGVELVSTDGKDATFAVTGFSLTTN